MHHNVTTADVLEHLHVQVKASSASMTASSSEQVLALGKAIPIQLFKKITAFLQTQPVKNNVDFCVGILDDDEQVMNVIGIQYRVLGNKIAIERLIFKGQTQNFKAKYANQVFSRQITLNDIKKLNVEKQVYLEKGEIVDEFNHRRYTYSKIYILREKNRDDLVYAYFDQEKLLALRYVVQC